MRFNEILKKLREDENLTQKALAEKTGTTQRNISFYESGKIEPSIDMLNRFADFFDVDVDVLTGRKNY